MNTRSSTSAHVPGPWSVEADYGSTSKTLIYGGNGSGHLIADCAQGWSEDEANARLIAAAPDMLAALQLASAYIMDIDGGDQHSESGWRSEELLDVWAKVRTAIAKATGAA